MLALVPAEDVSGSNTADVQVRPMLASGRLYIETTESVVRGAVD